MERERWQRVERLYHSALECQPGDRAVFLEQACEHDKDLRHEVESLLACQEKAADFIESPALEVAGTATDQRRNRDEHHAFPFAGYHYLALPHRGKDRGRGHGRSLSGTRSSSGSRRGDQDPARKHSPVIQTGCGVSSRRRARPPH